MYARPVPKACSCLMLSLPQVITFWSSRRVPHLLDNKLGISGHLGFTGLHSWGTTGIPVEPHGSIQFCIQKKLSIKLEIQQAE